ncbi:FKBP-type peptidyl-prolyl cis-trans isomerase [Halobellus rubicundus]|uniref:Peptidyl-prolyl cis-trans isomerase n=1 Tax=Halobellus rubicundus TaxID=2996466 RepID=A0ABD5MHS9_9EURY
MTIDAGDEVAVEYVGRFEDGTVFGTSKYDVAVDQGLADPAETDPDAYGPLVFVVGADEVIQGLDDAVRGMDAGESATVRVPPEAAYGEVREERVREYDVEAFTAMVGTDPTAGMHVEAENGLHGDVVAVREGTVEVDFNHELAGRTLVFEIEILDVEIG